MDWQYVVFVVVIVLDAAAIGAFSVWWRMSRRIKRLERQLASGPVGWVIQHTEDKFELDYFHCAYVRRRPKDGGEVGTPMPWAEWMAAYRPRCVLKRMRLVEVHDEQR